MKNIFKYILFSALTITAVASCEDDRNNFLPEDSFGFNNTVNNNMVTLPLYSGEYRLDVIKSGKGFNEGSVTIACVDTVLNSFNEKNETSFVAFPADKGLFSFSTENISFSVEDVTKPVTITWDIAKVSEHMSSAPDKNFCIPVVLASDNLEVNEGRDVFVLNLVKSAVTVEQRTISKTIEWESDPLQESMDITIRIDNPLPGMELGLDFDIDYSLVAEYNAANETNYEPAPEGLISLGANPVIKAGESSTLFTVTMDTGALVDPATGVVKTDWEGYVVPVSLKSMSIEGVDAVENYVTYFVVKGIRPVPPQLFNRLWGIYATSSTAPWQATFGLSDTRNITMDDEYIYIPQSAGGDPVLKAVSILNPAIVKNVNVEGISGGTHTLSCVRMIPNTDPAVNDGKDILVATNLTLGDDSHLHYYAWLNGIDNAPTKYMVDDSGRRMGDKFIVLGSWKNGEFYFKDYNSGNIVRNAMVETGIGEWPGAGGLAYARGRFDYSASVLDAANCIGSAYVYPGTANAGSGTPAGFLVTTTSSGHYLINNEGTTTFKSSSDLGLGMTHGYNFFTDSVTGSKYVAYVALDASQAMGSVKVISDFNGTPEGLEAVLQAHNIVFEAPIQDAMDATIISPCPATHSTGDCVVREVNGTTYMAVMIQNVGLSVFTLNAGFRAE